MAHATPAGAGIPLLSNSRWIRLPTRVFRCRKSRSPGRSQLAPRAEEGDDDAARWTADTLAQLEQYLVVSRNALDELDVPSGGRAFSRFAEGLKGKGLQKYDALIEIVQTQKMEMQAGEDVSLDKLLDDCMAEVMPSTPGAFALFRVCQTAVSVAFLGWFWSLFEIDPWRYWHMSDVNVLSWVIWTVPYLLCTSVLWRGILFADNRTVQAYKCAQINIVEQENSAYFLKDASIFFLAAESFSRSLSDVFRNQGCYFGATSVLSTGPVGNIINTPDSLMGDTQQLLLPKPLRSAQAAGALGLLLSLGSILEDPTLSTFLLSDAKRLHLSVHLSGVYTHEDGYLLMDEKVTESRRALTGVLGGLQAIYLASEMLATDSLFTPICTSAFGMLIFLQAVKQNLQSRELL